MKKIFSKTALSLIELIIAAALVAIVVLGIFSINMVLNNNNQDYGQRYLVKSSTQTTLNHILNNAFLAVGTGAKDDEAILIGAAGVGDANSFCIHQGNGNNMFNYSNSNPNLNGVWLCYTLNPRTNQISYCFENYTGGTDPRGASSCTQAIANGTLFPSSQVLFLGTAFSITNTGQSNLANTPNYANGLFSINIQNCLDNTSATGTCNAGGTSSDPSNNPEVEATASVATPQASY